MISVLIPTTREKNSAQNSHEMGCTRPALPNNKNLATVITKKKSIKPMHTAGNYI